jgi:hypothetical protein
MLVKNTLAYYIKVKKSNILDRFTIINIILAGQFYDDYFVKVSRSNIQIAHAYKTS